MAISDEVALIFKGQNLSGPAIDAALASLRAFKTEVGLTTTAIRAFNTEAGVMANTVRALIGPQNDLRYVMQTTTQAVIDQGVALRGLNTQAATAGLAGASATRSVAANAAVQDAGMASRLRLAGQSVGPLSLVTGGLPLPAVAAAVAGYLGYKTISTANQYNQSVADIVSQSTQNTASIPGLQTGVLNLAGGQNRFTPQQSVTGLYPIASSPIFAHQQDQIDALHVVLQQAQGSGAGSIQSLSRADVGAISAYGFRANQMGYVADVIQKGVNIGLAESPAFATGVGTFSAASLVADPNRQRAFEQAVGAFAQQTNLSPRFRFDAQGENAFFQQVTGRQTKTALQAETGLGITDMFGAGAIGRAGGLAQWLAQLQRVTGAAGSDNQQVLLQSIFGRQNALQFVRGFTGGNFASGQIAIGGTSNAGGTVARGADIADKGPQAQWDQIQGQFNKDVIEVGTTISKQLTPALAGLASSLLGLASKLGTGLGILGTDLDKANQDLSAWAQQHTLRPTVDAIGNAIGGVLGDIGGAGGANSGDHTGQSGQWVDVPTARGITRRWVPTATSGPSADPSKRWSPGQYVGTGQYFDPLTPLQHSMFSGPTWNAAAVNGPAVVDPSGKLVDASNDTVYRYGQGVDAAALRAASTAAALRSRTASNMGVLTEDRGSINYRIATGASNTQLDAALNKLRGDLGASGMDAAGQSNFLQKFGTGPVKREENQRIIDAATIQYNAATSFERSVQLHHSSLQASNAAAQQVYQASLNLIASQVKAGTLKKTDAANLQLDAQSTLQQSLTANLAFPMQEAQARLTLAQLTGKGLAGAQGDVAALLRQQDANAPNQLALALYQLYHSGATSTALPRANPAQLIRPITAGLGSLQANVGQSVAALAGGSGTEGQQAMNHLRQQVAYLQQLTQAQARQIALLESINTNTGGAATAAAHTARTLGTASHAKSSTYHHIRRHR